MHLRYLLDTNICIYIAKQRPSTVLERFLGLQPGEVGMSVVTAGELAFGAAKSQRSVAARESLAALQALIPVLPLNEAVAESYGNLRAALQASGTPIGNNDLWIGAHARQLHITLVSNNTCEFSRIEGLKLEVWV